MVYNYFVLFSSLLSRFKTILSHLELLCQTTLFLNQQLKPIPQSLISPNYVAGLRLCL